MHSITGLYSHHNSHNNNKRHRHHPKRSSNGSSSYFQNPCIVFVIILTTLSIFGSLRFRTNKTISRQQHITLATLNDKSNTGTINGMIEYVMIEEVIDDGNLKQNGRSHRKYVGIISQMNTLNDHQVPTAAITLDDTATTYVTVSQWVQMVTDHININHNNKKNNNSDTTRNMAIELLNDIIRTAPYTALFFETPSITSYQQYNTQRFEFVLVNAPDLNEMTVIKNHNHHDTHPFEKPLAKETMNTNPYAASFTNLGGDAILIVPKYIPSENVDSVHNKFQYDNMDVPDTARYAHLANFIRYHHHHSQHHHPYESTFGHGTNHRHQDMVYAVWQMVAKTYHEQIQSKFVLEQNGPFITSDQHHDGRSDMSHSKQQQQQQQGLWLSTSGMGVLYLHFRIDTVPKYYSYAPYKTKIHN